MLRSVYVIASAIAILGFAYAPATAEDITAEDYLHFWKPNIGTWGWNTTLEGERHTGTISFKVAPNGKCMFMESEGDGLPLIHRVDGYDPVGKKWVMTGYRKDGTYVVASLTVTGMKKGKVMAVGELGKWDFQRHHEDGTTVSGSALFSCTTLEEDHLVVQWSDRVENGKPLDTVVWTLDRKK